MAMSDAAMKEAATLQQVAALVENPRDIPGGKAQPVLRAAKLAIKSGAVPPLEFVGMGMAGTVLCDPRHAFKVAHSKKQHIRLSEEAEWFEAANSIPQVRPYVAKLVQYNQPLGVTVRECVRGKPGAWYANEPAQALFSKVAPYMLAAGWTMPEMKSDSVVYDSSGHGKIIDATHGAHRVSDRLLDWVEETLSGQRKYELGDNDSLLLRYIQNEFGAGSGTTISKARAAKLIAKLREMGAK